MGAGGVGRAPRLVTTLVVMSSPLLVLALVVSGWMPMPPNYAYGVKGVVVPSVHAVYTKFVIAPAAVTIRRLNISEPVDGDEDDE